MVACQTEISGTRLVAHASRVTAPRYTNRVSGHRRSDKFVLEIVPRRCGWYLSQSTVVQVAGTYHSQRLRNARDKKSVIYNKRSCGGVPTYFPKLSVSCRGGLT